MLQQNLSTTKSSSVPILVKKDQFHDDFNKLTVSDESMLPTLTFFAVPFAARKSRVLDHGCLRLFSRLCVVKGSEVHENMWLLVFVN